MNPNLSNHIVPPIAQVVVWSDKKRPFFGLPLSFTRYTLYTNRLMIDRGFLFRRQEEIRLYRLKDLKMTQGPFERLFGVGNIRLLSGDASTPAFTLQAIRQPYEVFLMLSDMAEEERRRVGVGIIESYGHL